MVVHGDTGALRKTASAHNKANRIFVYKRDGRDVSEDALKSQMRSKGLSTESRAAQLRNMVRTAENKAAAKRQNEAHMRRQEARSGRGHCVVQKACKVVKLQGSRTRDHVCDE